MSIRVKYMDFFEKHYRLDDFLFTIRFWQFLTWCHSMKGLIKYHPNRLHIKTLQRGWIDRDQQLLHACMQILIDFVDKEKSQDIVDWEWDENHSKASKTMHRLYDWWKYDPFAQDHWKMPNCNMTEVHKDPLGKIEDWINVLYMTSLNPDENSAWAKKVIKKLKKNPPEHLSYGDGSEEQHNEHVYYHCLNLIEQEAVNRQDKALKDLISIRGYLWT